jgi:hypothetical protein
VMATGGGIQHQIAGRQLHRMVADMSVRIQMDEAVPSDGFTKRASPACSSLTCETISNIAPLYLQVTCKFNLRK